MPVFTSAKSKDATRFNLPYCLVLTVEYKSTIRVPNNEQVLELPPDLGNIPLYLADKSNL